MRVTDMGYLHKGDEENMPWHRIELRGDDQQAFTGRRQRLVNTVSDARLRDGGKRRVALLHSGDNTFFLSPEASLLVGAEFLQDFEANECEKPTAGTVGVMVGENDTLKALGL